jgi:hypothetical protein
MWGTGPTSQPKELQVFLLCFRFLFRIDERKTVFCTIISFRNCQNMLRFMGLIVGTSRKKKRELGPGWGQDEPARGV